MDLCRYDALVGSLDNLFPELGRFDATPVEKLSKVRPSFDCQLILRPASLVPILASRDGAKDALELFHPMVDSSTRVRYRYELELAQRRCIKLHQTGQFPGNRSKGSYSVESRWTSNLPTSGNTLPQPFRTRTHAH